MNDDNEPDEALLDSVEGIMLELLSDDDPAKREEFIRALIHDGLTDRETIEELVRETLENKAAMRGLLKGDHT